MQSFESNRKQNYNERWTWECKICYIFRSLSGCACLECSQTAHGICEFGMAHSAEQFYLLVIVCSLSHSSPFLFVEHKKPLHFTKSMMLMCVYSERIYETSIAKVKTKRRNMYKRNKMNKLDEQHNKILSKHSKRLLGKTLFWWQNYEPNKTF